MVSDSKFAEEMVIHRLSSMLSHQVKNLIKTRDLWTIQFNIRSKMVQTLPANDVQSGVLVSSVTNLNKYLLGGAAYVCELSIGDEVLSMNGMTVAILSQDQIVEAGFQKFHFFFQLFFA